MWTIRFVSTPAFDPAYTGFLSWMLLVVGLALTALVGLALRSAALRYRALRNLLELRKRQLGAREDENRALIETNVSVVMLLDAAGQIIFANDAAAALFGCPRAYFIGRSFAFFVALRECADEGGISNATGVLPDATVLFLDVQANLWRTADDVIQTIVSIRDVTGQINNRAEIEALHRRYDVALAGAGIGVFDINLRTGEAEMSDTSHKILETDALNEPFDHREHFLEHVHPQDLAGLIEADRRCIA